MQKLKFIKTSLFLILAVLFISCENEIIDNTSPNIDNSRQVSSNQAKVFSSIVANNLFSTEDGAKLRSTRANELRIIDKIQYLISENQDTLMYSVNFGNDNGYILLSGDKGSFPIVAFVDSGSINLNSIDSNSPMASWLAEKKSQISKSIKDPVDTTSTNYQLWNSINNDSCEINIEFVKTIPKIHLKSTGTRRYSTNKATVYPFTGSKYKWGQGTGYNFNAPISGTWAGCPAVAVGLLCMHHKYPSLFDYNSMPASLPNNYNKQNAISLMFRKIGNKIPYYSWGVNGSGAVPNDILTGIKRLGYTRASFRNYDFEIAYNNLNSGNPILLTGYQDQNQQGGHIWFCDGYYEMSWKITKTIKYSGEKKTWYEYSDYIYMNWGWNGYSDGWYECNNWTATSGTGLNYYKSMFVNLYPVN